MAGTCFQSTRWDFPDLSSPLSDLPLLGDPPTHVLTHSLLSVLFKKQTIQANCVSWLPGKAPPKQEHVAEEWPWEGLLTAGPGSRGARSLGSDPGQPGPPLSDWERAQGGRISTVSWARASSCRCRVEPAPFRVPTGGSGARCRQRAQNDQSSSHSSTAWPRGRWDLRAHSCHRG